MADAVDIWEKPETEELYIVAGWRQWADAGSVSSGLPQYLIQQTNAKQIGELRSDGFYLFQIPGTHDLMRPAVKFKDGYPVSLRTQHNEFYYSGDHQRGMVIFIGDEPQLDAERYVNSFLDMARQLSARRIVGLGGVYGEVPYNRERLISSIYSLPYMKDELLNLAVNLSDYEGGASIGSYICRRASEQNLEYLSFYAFVPLYDFSSLGDMGNTVRVENDFTAWLGVMQRINYTLKLGFDIADLEKRSERLIQAMDKKIDTLEESHPELGLRAYLDKLSEGYTESSFNPLDEVWEEELRRLLDKFDDESEDTDIADEDNLDDGEDDEI